MLKADYLVENVPTKMYNVCMRKFSLKILTIFILCLCIPISANATTIDDIKKQQQETQKQLNSANSEISSLTEVRKGITDEIEQIDDELVELMTSISILEDEIKDIEAEIEVKKVELAEAERVMNEQYEAMKARIKFMYEKGEFTYMQLLFEAQSMGDLINKADYIEELYTYDRLKLLEIVAAKEAVEVAKANLEEQQEELITAHYELELEKDDLNALLDEKKKEAEDYDIQIARARQEAAAYKAQIKQQNNQIKKLEEEARKKAEEEAKRKAAEEAKRKAAEEAKKKAEEEAKKKAEAEANGETYVPEVSESSTSENSTSTSTSENADGTSSESTTSETTSSESTSSESSSESSSSSPVVSTGGGKGQDVANFACKYVGNPYVAGGTSLTNGADCSGFTLAVYQNFGYNLPRSSTSQRSAGTGVTYAEAQPGDIICYAGHVGIYIGNGQIVHASTPASGIKIGSATYREILAVRRIID